MKNRVSVTSDNFLLFQCPGCENSHGIPVDGSKAWQWNNSLQFPTITPSILIYAHETSPPFKPQPRCHSFITDGRILFLSDSGHKLAGQSVDLPEYEEE